VFGLAWSGAMTKSRLVRLLGRLPAGFVEIYLHPATHDAFADAAPGYRYADEFAALCDADCIAAAQRSGYAIGGYMDAST
jgi:chitin disaccharide deacetylase